MQYLLSEEEYAELIGGQLKAEERQRAILQDLCTRVANHEPVIIDSGDGTTHETTWGCILVSGEYCDHCPVQKQCPCDHKAYSK